MKREDNKMQKIILFILCSYLLLCFPVFSDDDHSMPSKADPSPTTTPIDFDNRLPESERSAFMYAKKIIQTKPLSIDAIGAQYQLGHIYKQNKMEKKSDEEFEKTIRLCENIILESKDPYLIDQAYYWKGRSHNLLKQYEKTVELAKEFYKKYPYSQIFLKMKKNELNALLEMGEYDKVLEGCDLLMNQYPQCSMTERDYKKYRSCMEKGKAQVLETEGKIQALEIKSGLYERKKDYQKQAEALKSAISIMEKIDAPIIKNNLKDFRIKLEKVQKLINP